MNFSRGFVGHYGRRRVRRGPSWSCCTGLAVCLGDNAMLIGFSACRRLRAPSHLPGVALQPLVVLVAVRRELVPLIDAGLVLLALDDVVVADAGLGLLVVSALPLTVDGDDKDVDAVLDVVRQRRGGENPRQLDETDRLCGVSVSGQASCNGGCSRAHRSQQDLHAQGRWCEGSSSTPRGVEEGGVEVMVVEGVVAVGELWVPQR